jgi:hypothetical protein
MKFANLLIIFFSICTQVFGQTCLPDGITISHQSTIDNFPDYYPGCQIILGDVIITGIDIDVSNVDSLFSINEIQGDLLFDGLEYGLLYFESLEGLYNLTTIGGELKLSGLMQTTTLEGLNSLESIGGRLWIGANPILEDISVLSNLTEINGPIWFSFNPVVNSLEGLENIDPSGIENIYIAHNELLSDCSILSLCTFLDLNTAPNDATINLNSLGCNSIEEVLNACITTELAENAYLSKSIKIQNPVYNRLQVFITEANLDIKSLKITSLDGKTILSQKYAPSIDVSYLKNGLYMLEIELSNGAIQSRKLIKL